MQWIVEVWFQTSDTYRKIAGKWDTQEAAAREARVYRSDSRGIRIISSNGEIVQIKAETRF
jgi:hypothetical protein